MNLRKTPATRALSYLKKVYGLRNIRTNENGGFDIESGADYRGETYWHEVAIIATPSELTDWKALLIDTTGDDQRILAVL